MSVHTENFLAGIFSVFYSLLQYNTNRGLYYYTTCILYLFQVITTKWL